MQLRSSFFSERMELLVGVKAEGSAKSPRRGTSLIPCVLSSPGMRKRKIVQRSRAEFSTVCQKEQGGGGH